MTKKAFNVTDGLHSAAAYTAFENRAYGSVKASAASLVVSAGTGMNASIAVGDGIIADGDLGRRFQITAVESATVPAAHATFARIDSLVVYFDKTVTPDGSVDNTNDVIKFMVVAGTASGSPTAPSGATIQSAITAGNPYMILCNITVPAAATNLSGATFNNLAPTVLLAAYPIGAIYESVVSTSPQTLFGGAWTAFGTGRVTVGIDAGQTEFDVVEETGGEKTHVLTTTEMPAHTHSYSYKGLLNKPEGTGGATAASIDLTSGTTGSTGGGAAHNNLQPYVVVYRWKRTA